ncbi:hypothetical protein LO763_25095 [Glycomyces sp. A-F 0318]|uniref:hypothetical protein n=1 Tax=Glycomyces amatae TaxID=2881355 RepID=UPI001E382A65|nr:hypothetical protein [Glycomyces amatae]MCD0446901.1 hypothetical protein [Glycomyces amatae]
MSLFPLTRRGWSTIAVGAVQTVVATVAAFRWLDSGGMTPAVVLFGSWAALALAGMITGGAAQDIAQVSAGPVGDRVPPEPDPRDARLLKWGALLPLCQVAVGAAVAALAGLGGFAVSESALAGPGVGGAFGTAAMVALGAYLALLCGVILVLVTVVPGLMLWRAARRRDRSRVTVAASAVILLAVFPSAIGAVQGVAVPDGASSRGAALPLMLTVLGFDLSDRGYTVEHWGWLWTARIFGALILLGLAAAVLAGRAKRTAARAAADAGRRPRRSADRDRRATPSPRPRRRAGDRPSTRKKRKKRKNRR